MDIETLAMAKAYCSSKGGSIRLNDYHIAELSASETILYLALTGGGVVTTTSGCEKLWEDILQKHPTHLILSTGCDASVAINILSADKTSDPSNWFASGIGVYYQDGIAIKITVVLSANNDGKGMTISVLSEPITFPEIDLASNEGGQA